MKKKPAPKKPLQISNRVLEQSRRRKPRIVLPSLTIQSPPPGVLPKGMAMDSASLLAQDQNIRAMLNWAQGQGQMAMDSGLLGGGFGSNVMNEAFWSSLTLNRLCTSIRACTAP